MAWIAPPPTKYGPQITVQAKAAPAGRVPIAPPPTKFEHERTAQTKTAAQPARPDRHMPPPPTKYGKQNPIQRQVGFTAPAKIDPGRNRPPPRNMPSRTIQRAAPPAPKDAKAAAKETAISLRKQSLDAFVAAINSPPKGTRFVFRGHFTSLSAADGAGGERIWSKAVEDKIQPVIRAGLGLADSPTLKQVAVHKKKDVVARGLFDARTSLYIPQQPSLKDADAALEQVKKSTTAEKKAYDLKKQHAGSHKSVYLSLCVDRPTASQVSHLEQGKSALYIYCVPKKTLIENRISTVEKEWFTDFVLSEDYFVKKLSKTESEGLLEKLQIPKIQG